MRDFFEEGGECKMQNAELVLERWSTLTSR